MVEAGTLPLDEISRAAIFTGMRPGLSRPMRGIDGGVGWKASAKPGRDGVSGSRQAGSKPVVLFPSGPFKPLSVSISGMPGLLDCAWSRLS